MIYECLERTEAGGGRWLRFGMVFVLKLLPAKFSEAGEVQDASPLRISDVKNPGRTARGLVRITEQTTERACLSLPACPPVHQW